MPDLMSRLAKSAALANKIVSGLGSPGDQALLANESLFFEESLNRLSASNAKSFESDAANHGVSPTLQPKLSAALQSYRSTLTNYISTIKAVGVNPTQTSAVSLATQAATAQRASLEYWNTSAQELDTLLNTRVSDFQSSRIQALGFSALAVVVATIVAFLIGRSITRPLQELVRNLGPGATLLGVSVERIAEASHSQTPSQEESQIICEELNAHAENMRQAVLELARHVEGSAAASRLASQESGQSHS
jgi:methyl-accepting chemotaxis protein